MIERLIVALVAHVTLFGRLPEHPKTELAHVWRQALRDVDSRQLRTIHACNNVTFADVCIVSR